MSTRQTTDPGMLPQSQALESVSADNPGVGTKRGTEAEAAALAPGAQHGLRERTGDYSPVSTPSQRHQSGSQDGRSNPAPARSPAPRVFVLDKHHRPLDSCHPARARELLRRGRAVVHRRSPFVIRLKDRTLQDSVTHTHTLGVNPGSKTTGLAVVNDGRKLDTYRRLKSEHFWLVTGS